MAKEIRSQERGQARIQQLMEMFLELPREVVLRADYDREGVKHTAVLDEVGRWAWPDAHGYYEFDYEEHTQQEGLVGGVSRTPKNFCFGKGPACYLFMDSRSPYEMRYEGGGRYWLYRDGEPIEEVYFLPCPQWFWKKTSSGKAMSSVIDTNFERHFNVCITTYCEYFKDGNQCLYCNMNPTGNHIAELGQERMLVKREQDIYETYLAFAQEMGVDGISLIAGGFYNRSKEADLYLRTIKVLKRAMRDSGCHTEHILLAIQAMEEQDQRRLKEAGATDVHHMMDVWDPKLFEIICPGKAKSVGRERWVGSLLRAVEIFGWGKVSTNFVTGVELVPPFGFKTEEEAAESLVEGFQFLASHGVSLRTLFFRPRRGAVLEKALSPRSEYFLRMEQEAANLQKEYNLPKLYPY